MKNGLFVFALLLLLSTNSCSSNDSFEPTCSGVTISFAAEVKPITDSKCATNSGCHASGSSHGALTTYTQIFNSKAKISSVIKSGSMPRNGSLTTDQKNTILCWIESGALNN
jgi:hypothetical protein